MNKRKATVAIFICISLCMLIAGFAYVWHWVPASEFTGVTPPSKFDTLEGWYAYNEFTGAALLFIAASNLVFLAIANRKFESIKKLIFAMLFCTVINVITAAIFLEFFTNLINTQ